MWKIAVAFVAFAALALFIIMQGGDKVDMRGESAAHEQTEHAAPATPAPAPAAPAAPAAK